MTGRQGRIGRTAAGALLAVVVALAMVVAALSSPAAVATPESDAHDAITAAWNAAGGEASPLGAPHGDVYPVGAGFAQDFAGGKMFFTPETGAKALHGAILDKYESLGGAANSDLGFPNIDEVPGLVSPDSRMVTFSATDSPVIFWTPEHGAYVVRGVMNAGWDKLGSSAGALGAPIADEGYDGNVVTQKFGGGQLSWDSQTGQFSTVPPELAQQLADLQVQVDPTEEINRAWRAAGGAAGSLGVRQGGQYQVGGDGAGQDFAGGKVYYSPATGAHAVEGEILAKYESLGGPVGSDLGFPATNETDGGIPGSRFSGFSADDQPVIFFTPDTGAFVVRGAMKVAWDKLEGASGALGAPVGDQAVEGDAVSQKFSGGKISWNRVTNTFGTEPANLAKSLSGLQLPGVNAPSGSSAATGAAHGGWHWWWLLIALAVLAVLGALAWLVLWWRRRSWVGADAATASQAGRPRGADHTDLDDQWSVQHIESDSSVRLPSRYGEPPGGPPSGVDVLGQSGLDFSWAAHGDTDLDDLNDLNDQDAVDTAPTRIPAEPGLGTGRHAVVDQGTDPGAGLNRPVPGGGSAYPAMHLPLDDPYQVPDGYPVKANTGSGLYYTAESALYDDTLAEIWFANEEAAQLNGFIKAR